MLPRHWVNLVTEWLALHDEIYSKEIFTSDRECSRALSSNDISHVSYNHGEKCWHIWAKQMFSIGVLPLFRKASFLTIASTSSPPFQCCNMLCGHFDLLTRLKRGEGGEMSKLDMKLTRLTKQVFFGESQLLLSMIVAFSRIILTLI